MAPAAIGALLLMLMMLSSSACLSDPDPLPPFGEALVVVDTDVPVPQVASRLRIDLLTEGGSAGGDVVFASRDDIRPDPRDWPTSFSVFTDDTAKGRVVLMRLRAYLEGRVTASGEPDPSLAIDRLVRVRLEPGHRGRVVVTLRGECAGVAANLTDKTACGGGGDTTIDAAIEENVVDRTLAASAVGSFGREPCAAAPAASTPSGDRICVPGGAFVLGDRFYRPSVESSVLSAGPERVVRVSRVLFDRDEVTVARYRAALARGFAPPIAVKALERDGAPGAKIDDACTFSASPRGREEYAISCVPWVTADAFCKFEDGALPTEAQWEYAALAAERARKAVYPWGDDAPGCERAVYGRSALADDCLSKGEGPQLPNAAREDITPLGIRDLGGGFEEHVADSVSTRFDDACWTPGESDTSASLNPICTKPVNADCQKDAASLECRLAGEYTHVTRGGGWTSFSDQLLGIARSTAQASTTSELIGFRCVYSAP